MGFARLSGEKDQDTTAMKRLLTCFALLLSSAPAQASSELAQQWGLEAHRLSLQTAQIMFAIDTGQSVAIEDAYVMDLYRFGRTSRDLAAWSERTGRSEDLGCMFRDMANQATAQLSIFEDDQALSEQRESLRHLESMFDDAVSVAIIAQRHAQPASHGKERISSRCSVASRGVLDHLR